MRGGPGRTARPVDRAKGEVAVEPEKHGDVVLARKETATGYRLAVALDGADQGVILVTRGEDLFPLTGGHRLLQALLALPIPLWHHHSYLTDPEGPPSQTQRRAVAARLAPGRQEPRRGARAGGLRGLKMVLLNPRALS